MTLINLGTIRGATGATGPTLPLPLEEDLTFAPDNDHDIGPAGFAPRDVFVGRNLSVGATSTFGGHMRFSPDNTFDIGASADLRPRDVYIGNGAVVGSASGGVATGGVRLVRFDGATMPALSVDYWAVTPPEHILNVGGTGVVVAVRDRLRIHGSLHFQPDGVHDIGVNPNFKPRDVYIARELRFPRSDGGVIDFLNGASAPRVLLQFRALTYDPPAVPWDGQGQFEMSHPLLLQNYASTQPTPTTGVLMFARGGNMFIKGADGVERQLATV